MVWDSKVDDGALSLREPITPFGLNDSMFRLAFGVQSWDPWRFEFSHKLQAASRNHGRVDAMADLEARCYVAVKKMPNWWIRSGPDEFWRSHPRELEQPRCDLGVLKELKSRGFPYICELMGVFVDRSPTHVVTSLATGGDLHTWTKRLPAGQPERERAVLPVAAQLYAAVALLHDVGVAHRDLSLENVLLSSDDLYVPVEVKLIDFGMAAVGRIQGNGSVKAVAGKKSYAAPEVHLAGPCDAFLGDAFSIGVMLYCTAMWEDPCQSTAPGASASLEHARKVGMASHLASLLDMGASPEVLEVLAGLLEIEPSARMCLGEACFLEEGRASAPETAWLRAAFASTACDGDERRRAEGTEGARAPDALHHDAGPSPVDGLLTSTESTASQPCDADDVAGHPCRQKARGEAAEPAEMCSVAGLPRLLGNASATNRCSKPAEKRQMEQRKQGPQKDSASGGAALLPQSRS